MLSKKSFLYPAIFVVAFITLGFPAQSVTEEEELKKFRHAASIHLPNQTHQNEQTLKNIELRIRSLQSIQGYQQVELEEQKLRIVLNTIPSNIIDFVWKAALDFYSDLPFTASYLYPILSVTHSILDNIDNLPNALRTLRSFLEGATLEDGEDLHMLSVFTTKAVPRELLINTPTFDEKGLQLISLAVGIKDLGELISSASEIPPIIHKVRIFPGRSPACPYSLKYAMGSFRILAGPTGKRIAEDISKDYDPSRI